MKPLSFLVSVLLLAPFGLPGMSAQESKYASTVCHEDGTVTFNYRNDQAREVQVDVQFAGRKAMKRDAQTGLWTVTLGPAAPDMYPYCFVVDGVSIMDPQCDLYFPNEGFKNSLLEIPGRQSPLPHDVQKVPHGSIEYVRYFSKSLGATNNAIVYLPPTYQRHRHRRYPVFYLISGTTDTEEVYYKVGRANYILDNLIAKGQAEEMIIVMPYGNPYKLLPTPTDVSGMPQTRFGRDVFSLDLNNDLMPYIDEHFRTIPDADHRAIGGFSRGGNQALFNGLRNLDKFSYLCSYSSFTSTDIPGVYDNAADTNGKIHLFWLGVGTDDFLYGNARDYMAFLDSKGIRSVKEFTNDKFGHTWMNAKYFLTKTMPLLFRPEAAEEAMKQAKPTPEATGNEQQFTPAVMARLFPRPILSPEYRPDATVFRFQAPEAKQVQLVTELDPKPIAMQRDTTGVWEAEWKGDVMKTFTYYFLVDGTPVADPQNMYLAPSQGFKPSIYRHPFGRYSFATMPEGVQHGQLSYNLDTDEAWYIPPVFTEGQPPLFIQLVPGKGDTMESWFKVGGADAMADRLIADKRIRPCIITTSKLQFLQNQPDMMKNVRTLKADDYKTWDERQQALEALLTKK